MRKEKKKKKGAVFLPTGNCRPARVERVVDFPWLDLDFPFPPFLAAKKKKKEKKSEAKEARRSTKGNTKGKGRSLTHDSLV